MSSKVRVIKIQQTIYLTMLAHVQAFLPEEACGLLAGSNGQITHLYIIENILHSPVTFEMNPQQQLNAMLHIENLGLDLFAAYHSHPGGPSKPSETDISQAYYPDLVQIIISLQDPSQPTTAAYTIINGQVGSVSIAFFS
ncbi:MAG: M67 family metallopeptidase [Candidatus Promineifilaceae bacterium]|nr:M67 family metallopeptidase [Candidatus Promineifilaceae bacterium]